MSTLLLLEKSTHIYLYIITSKSISKKMYFVTQEK